MAKKKSKTSKAYLRKQARKELKIEDKKWALAIKERDGFKCIICGKTDWINSHHIVPREILATRHLLANGVCLCSLHHRWDRKISGHKNPFMFIRWFRANRLGQYEELMEAIANEQP